MSEFEGVSKARSWWEQQGGAASDARRAYDRRNSQELVRAATTVLLRRLPFELPSTVIDLGCGDGTLLRSLSQAGFAHRYVGIDPHPQAVTTAELEILTGPAELALDVVAENEGPVVLVATLTVGLWDDPERVLIPLLADHGQVRHLLIADIVRPVTEQARSIWRSFAVNAYERRYLEDHLAVLLTAPHWVQFISKLTAAVPGLDLQVETFDLRTPGRQAKLWRASEMDEFEEHLQTSPVPLGLFLRAFR